MRAIAHGRPRVLRRHRAPGCLFQNGLINCLTVKDVREEGTDVARIRGVLLVDGHPIVRDGLAAWIDSQAGLEVVGHAASADEAQAIKRQLNPDLVVVGVALRNSTGIELTRRLVARRDVCILGLSGLPGPGLAMQGARMLLAGATGFALKSQPSKEILDALRMTLERKCYITPAIEAEVKTLLHGPSTVAASQLTVREREIWKLVVKGYSTKEIGQALFISPRTVEVHRQHVMRKLGVRSLAALILCAVQTGEWIDS
ncbi:MAG TPA: response regulator transcription factor [Kofleriaceae bacterium]|nr:response regulator transcription factor [Kofleriaceae bacterium]